MSPTKRLIEFKNASVKHGKTASVFKNVDDEDEYSIRYTPSPKKSYIIKPQEGEIAYEKIEKMSPEKRYE